MTRLVLAAALAAMVAAPQAYAQTANGSPTAPAPGGASTTSSMTAPSAGTPAARARRLHKSASATPTAADKAAAGKSRKDIEDEKRLERDMKICIGC